MFGKGFEVRPDSGQEQPLAEILPALQGTAPVWGRYPEKSAGEFNPLFLAG